MFLKEVLNNAKRKNNKILRDRHKYEFSLFDINILGSTENDLSYLQICVLGPIPYLLIYFLSLWTHIFELTLDNPIMQVLHSN